MDGRKSATDERLAPAGLARRALARSVPACALAALAAIVVAGCGESSNSGSTTTTVAQSTQATSSATTPAGAAPGSSQVQPSASGSAHATSTAKTPTTPFTVKTPQARAARRGILGPKAAQRALNLLGLGGKMTLTSSAFSPAGQIATRYTCDGAGTSPQIQWHGVPRGTAQLFLEVGDIAGGKSGLVQWAIAIPASASEIPAGSLPPGAVAGVNSAGKIGWGGVCGPKGVLQHVTFLMYALRHKLSLQSGFNPSQARSALKDNMLATGLTLATYKR